MTGAIYILHRTESKPQTQVIKVGKTEGVVEDKEILVSVFTQYTGWIDKTKYFLSLLGLNTTDYTHWTLIPKSGQRVLLTVLY
jgi:hypothetical protein